jgi:hypothetical protein
MCLRQLYRRLRGYKIWLYVDRTRWHKGEDIDIFLENHRRLSIEYLPPCQPGWDVQERIWRRVRYELTTNYWFSTPEETWITASKTVHPRTPAKIKCLCNVT